MRSLLAIVVAFVSLLACTSQPVQRVPHPFSAYLEYEQVQPKLRRRLGMRPGDKIESCGALIFAGSIKTGTEMDEVVIEDGPANYYDNRSGRRVAACGYWNCSRHNAYCAKSCPPKEWTCTSNSQ